MLKDKSGMDTRNPQSDPPNGSDDSTSMSRTRRVVFRLLLGMFAVAIALAISEVALWIIAPVPYSEWLVWEPEGHIRARPAPGQTVHTADGIPVRINKYGFRGPDYEYEKKPGTLRIVVLGGSAGFCFHASGREGTWAAILERNLSDRLEMTVEVVNLSLPGYDIFNSKLNYLCFGRAFGPDAVIVYHTWNDIKHFRSIPTKPYTPVSWVPNKPLWQRIARATQLGRRARHFLWNLSKRKMESAYQSVEGTKIGFDAPVDQRAFDWERQNFVDAVRMIQAADQLPILVSQAALATTESLKDPEVRFTLGDLPAVPKMTIPILAETWRQVSKIIEDVASETGAIFVDGYNLVPHDLIHLSDHVHLRDAGAARLAEVILETLLADDRFLERVTRVRAEQRELSQSENRGEAP